jgi:N-formylmaleamate deformylase
MASWNTRNTVVNGVRFHSTRTGGNKPPVVLAHGFSDAGLCWTPVALALEGYYDLVMVDARGHGLSDAPETGYTLPEMASDLQGVITSLGLVRPAILGHSMGGGTTLALAGLYPDVPGAIILEDAGALDASDFPRRQEGEENPFQARLARLQAKTRDELVAEMRASSGWPEAELGPWADAKLQFNMRAAQFHPTNDITWADLLPRITCPALLITADLDRGAIVRPEMAAVMQQQMPQLQVTHIPGAGHSVRREQFDRYITVVRSFLDTWAATYQQASARP